MKIRLHLKIFIFVIFFIITRQIKFYGILMLFAFVHELGHILTGIILGFKPYSLEIMPVGLSISFKSKLENYNKKIGKATALSIKKIIIAIAGPLTNFVIVALAIRFSSLSKDLIIYSNLLIAIFNMLPIYPLDGGRILKGILDIFWGRKKAYILTNKISNLIVILLTAVTSILVLYYKNIAILIVITYLWYLVIMENKKIKRKERLYTKIENVKNSIT